MKKILCLLVAVLASLQMLLAVPKGIYCDSNGKQRVIVNGDTIHTIDDNGYVDRTYMVVREEDSNGRFYVKLVVNGQIFGEEIPYNFWWSENGEVYLQMMCHRKPLVRKYR